MRFLQEDFHFPASIKRKKGRTCELLKKYGEEGLLVVESIDMGIVAFTKLPSY